MKSVLSRDELRKLEILAARAARNREALDAIEDHIADVLDITKAGLSSTETIERNRAAEHVDALHDIVWNGESVAKILDRIGVARVS